MRPGRDRHPSAGPNPCNVAIMRTLTALLLLGAGMLPANPASASCQCTCVNGQAKAICQSSLDVAPVCPPRVCAIPPPSMRPLDAPRTPPAAAKQCRMEQVLNRANNRYEWQQVCR
jgi:hypothetical protein